MIHESHNSPMRKQDTQDTVGNKETNKIPLPRQVNRVYKSEGNEKQTAE